ncbi:putative Alpha-(1,3)-fucosyltransferase C [Hypsibius exemplaris]|uniref:Fucosyltransferase n=1 Tax=Hypsibius exemplaris TaxID=2072580 RepID=A0A9X6RMH9_HYPEX|nr:putative Alpha-(1,3)-fucosyltransferase C [Hypsibius exemplaris]
MPEFLIRDLPQPEQRTSDQLFVFTMFESVANRYFLPSRRHWNELDRSSGGYFNLTMTYRLDSHVFFDSFSGFYRPHFISSLAELLLQKAKGILWLVSHCKTSSHREDYVAELSRFVKVDKFGKCSGLGVKNPCPYPGCPDDFIRQYRFYLAFENSFCRDYVTEKVYWALNNDVVPIVMGGANYSRFLPPNSYLNVRDYLSPKALADHLLVLTHNETEYGKYFQWKLSGATLWEQPNVLRPSSSSGWCKLCETLHQPRRPGVRAPAVVHNITDWWFRGQCHSFPMTDQLHAKRHPHFLK